MPDDRIYDAINLFKYSQTGLGQAQIGGDAAYQARYRSLAADVVEELWGLWSDDEIGYAHLAAGLVGDSATRFGCNIRVTSRLEPPLTPAQYQTPTNQGKLAATSCNLAHEATHLVRGFDSYPESEILCRTIQLFYFRELKTPRSYLSRVTGSTCTAAFLPTTPFYHDYESRLHRLQSHDLIDSIFAIEEYRRDLETGSTADFIARSLDWWGGISHRWPGTRGYFLRSLASCDSEDYAHPILKILESMSPAQWQVAKTCAGDLENIRRGLASGYHIYNSDFTGRIANVQETLVENFGILPS